MNAAHETRHLRSWSPIGHRQSEDYAVRQAMRRLIPVPADNLLDAWGSWCRTSVGRGFSQHSAGMGGNTISSIDDWLEAERKRIARVSDAIINEMPLLWRNVLCEVYVVSVMKFRPGMIEKVLPEAAATFWIQAKERGIGVE